MQVLLQWHPCMCCNFCGWLRALYLNARADQHTCRTAEEAADAGVEQVATNMSVNCAEGVIQQICVRSCTALCGQS